MSAKIKICCAAAAWAASSAARADTVVDNLGEPVRARTVLGTTAPDVLWAAQAFVSPGHYRLDFVQVLVGDATADVDPVARLSLGSFPDAAPLTACIVEPLPATGLSVVTLTPTTPVTLRPNGTYWIALGPASAGSFAFAYAEGNGFAGPGAIGPFTYSEDYGVTWGSQGADNPHQIRVEATPIECPADFNNDGIVGDIFDLFDFLAALDLGEDFNADTSGGDIFDLFDFLALFDQPCP